MDAMRSLIAHRLRRFVDQDRHRSPQTVRAPQHTVQEGLSTPLGRVITLLIANLGLIAITTVLVVIMRNSLIDYQLTHLTLEPGTDVQGARRLLENTVWLRVAVTLLACGVYALLIGRLRRGSRWAYLRVLYLSIVGLAAIVYLTIDGDYPVWMQAQEILQALVLAALLWSITRPELRVRFAKPRNQ